MSPASMNLAVRTVRGEPKAASSAGVMVRGGASPRGCADKGPTPFFDLLQAMIEAQAAEKAGALQEVGATARIESVANAARTSRRTRLDTIRPAANPRRRAPQLNVCVVGLIVATGGVFFASEAGEEQPRAIGADETFQARSIVIGNADANDKPMEKSRGANEPGDSLTIGGEQARMDEGGIVSESAPGAHSNDPTVATPVVGQPIEELGSDTENRADGGAAERTPSEAVRTASVAPARDVSPEPSRGAVSPPSVTPETGPASDRANDPVAIHVGRVVSGVNMRAGPGNGQPVLATISRGSPIEVIQCRQWCEVMFAGQRGWIYRTFIRVPSANATVSPKRAKPTPQKVGSNSRISGGTRSWAERRLKPATARLSADQSTRDARNRSQSGSGLILWDAIAYLWKQIRPTALLPNSD